MIWERYLLCSWILIFYSHAEITSSPYDSEAGTYFHPCLNHTVILSHQNRTVNYTLQVGDVDVCESAYIEPGWYRYEQFQNIPTQPPEPGQCGSSSPIWLNGTYPFVTSVNYLGGQIEYHTMKACLVSSTSSCEQSWDVTVVNCVIFNVVYLEPISHCGRYCMEPKWNLPSWYNRCFLENSVLDSSYNRTVESVLQNDDTDVCESSQLTPGWYRFELFQNFLTTPPYPGQCSSSHPIWLDGSYPTVAGENNTLTACMVGNSSNCERSWNVTALNCLAYNVVYLAGEGCGRYCMSDNYFYSWNDPCFVNSVIDNDYTRLVSYSLQNLEEDKCDTVNLTEGWYRFQNYANVPNYPPKQGQCGSMSPIWFQGLYPTMSGENSTMTACKVGNYSDCEESWNVTVMHCYGYNIAYLKPVDSCGKFCMDSSFDYGTTTFPTKFDPCYDSYVIDSDPSRYVSHTLQWGEEDTCDTAYIIQGWYRFENYENVVNYPPLQGQCGSSSPIWFQGSYPTLPGENITMTACMVGNYSSCDESWSVNVMHCNGYNVAYLKPVSKCGRFCVDSHFENSSTTYPTQTWSDPCNENFMIYRDSTRYVNYTLQSGEVEQCDTTNLTEGWYRYEGYDTIPNYPPSPGQCGSSSPIWFQGSYPAMYGENKTMIACMVGTSLDCEESWSVNVKFCYGYYVAYLKPVSRCGRYCIDVGYFEPSYSDHPMEISDSDHFQYSTQHFEWDASTSESTFMSENIMYTDIFSDQYTQYLSPSSAYTPLNTETIDESPGDMTSAFFEHSSTTKTSIYGTTTIPQDFSFTNIQQTSVTSDLISSAVHGFESITSFSSGEGYFEPEPSSSDNFMEVSNTAHFQYSTQEFNLESSGTDSTSISQHIFYTNDVSNQYSDELEPSPSSAFNPWSAGPSYQSPGDMTFESSTHTSIPTMSIYATSSIPDDLSFSLIYSTSVSNAMISTAVHESESTTSSTTASEPAIEDVTTDATTQTWYDPCYYHYVIESDVTRSVNYTLQPLEEEQCDTTNITEGWYRYEGYQNVPNYSPSSGQCGSSSPIWFRGSYPTAYGENRTMKACMVGNSSSCEDVWNVMVMNCGGYNVVYLKPVAKCGRFCIEMPYQSSLSLTLQPSAMTTSYEIYPTSITNDWMSTIVYNTEASTSSNTVDLSNVMYLNVDPVVPTYDPNSAERQLMFKCHYYIYGDESVLNTLLYDVRWEINDVEFIVKSSLTLTEVYTSGRLKSSELIDQNMKMGFNVKCGIRISNSANRTFVDSWVFYAGIEVWPNTLSISSGESATIYVWSTVPVACINDKSYNCKLWIEMLEFNEQFTSGAPLYCNNSVTELTKPSLCGLELNGWRTPWTWQTLDINLPANTAQDQEYKAKLQLFVREAEYDALWSNVHLPEITIFVVNDNVTEDYWWWYGYCFTGTDPWFFTFDWQWYGFHDEGEFVLYRHKTKPIEVHTIQRRYEPDHTWTEHCAIAIRAASDVFIIYGCGRPTKWIVRREGCDGGNEYLEVYSRWGGYEVTLPTGSRVYVWISVNRRLNAYITLSRSDRYETEGLCGTWNMNWKDDYTGRDGIVYDTYSGSTAFARTWSVPESDSLFIAKRRTEKLSQSVLYCSCLGDTLDQTSGNVDCSWKETQPVCPPANFGKESCKVRTKRSADVDDDDDVVIDVSPDIVAYTERPEVGNGWTNGWNESSAEDACNKYFNESVLFAACSSLSNVNGSSAINNCILNIQTSGTDEYMADSFEMFKTQCSNEVRTNNTLWSETNEDGLVIASVITENSCPFDCKYKGVKHGDCIKGYCNCYTGFAGDDCRVNMTAPPIIANDLSDESFCDFTSKACTFVSVFGENFYESQNLRCRVQTAEIIDNQLRATDTNTTTTALLQNLGEVKCPLTAGAKRKKRSTASTNSTNTYLVSVSNDGQEYSYPVPVILYDSSCTTCTTSGIYVVCQQRSDVCVVEGICYAETSSQCATPSESSDSKLWIIGVVISVLLFIIIIIIVIKLCTGSRPISPICGGEQVRMFESYSPEGRYAKSGARLSIIRVDENAE